MSIILTLFIPVVYGAILLTTKMHPTDHMDNLPVAVVNNDEGVIQDGEQLHVGNQLVENLQASETLGWDFVDTTSAMEGLQNNDYYMVIVIPEEFSNNVLTLTEPDPKKLELSFIQNEGLSFNAATITDRAAETIKSELERSIIHQFASTVVEQVGGGFEEAADGSEQLAEGTDQLLAGTEQLRNSVTGNVDDIERLASGSQELKAGTSELNQSVTSQMSDIARLASGSQELKEGTSLILSNLRGNSGDINRLASGAQELHAGTKELKAGTEELLNGLSSAKSGSTQLYEGLTNEIVPGSEALAAGSIELADGVVELVDTVEPLMTSLGPLIGIDPEEAGEKLTALRNGVHQLKDGAHQLKDGLTTRFQPGLKELDEGLSELLAGQRQVVAGVSELEGGASQIADGTASVRSGWNELTEGASQLDAGASQIADGNSRVNEGWKTLASGTQQLDAGASQIAEGNAQVNEGWKDLVEGSTELNDGAQQLNEGSYQLLEGLQSGVETISPMKQEDNIEMFASPVEMAFERINSPEYYRDTTAPFVMSLALFVGILILSLFMNFKRPADVAPLKWFASRFVNLTCLAIIQAVLLLVYSLLFIRMQATNPGLLILTLFVAAATFSAIVLFLAAIAGNVGRFIAVVFVVLQLKTTGGDLPVIMLSDTLQNVSMFLPFHYSIAGIRTALMLGNTDQIFFNMAMMLVFAVVALVLTYLVYMFKKDTNVTNREEADVTPSSAY